MSDRRVFDLVATGRWQSPLPRTYVTFSGPIPPVTMLYAALLYAGPGSTLSHDTAGWLEGLCKRPAAIHVTIPYGRTVRNQPGLVIHRSRDLRDDDVHPVRTPRRTRIERTVLDMLSSCRNAEAALSLIADAIRGRGTTVPRLRAALNQSSFTRWRKIALEVLPDIERGAHSYLEIRDVALHRRHGLPAGERQFKRLADGSEYLDGLIKEWALHWELDGRLGHDRARDIWRDFRRDNRSAVARQWTLRYGWADMIDHPCEVAWQRAQILMQQGWPGPFRRCRDCPADLC